MHNPEQGCNCQLLVHAITQTRGYEIPSHFRSSELFEDKEFTQEVNIDQTDTGDIFGFWYDKDRGPKYIHLGLAWKKESDLMIVHNSKRIGQMVIEPLDQVLDIYNNEYEFIKRPKVFVPALRDEEILNKLGLDFLK